MKFLDFLIASLILMSCNFHRFSSDLINLSVGMSSKKVTEVLGPPDESAVTQDSIHTITCLKYCLYPCGRLEECYCTYYFLYFVNDSLKSWGRPEDWSNRPDFILEKRER
jgi:hypothetical protein